MRYHWQSNGGKQSSADDMVLLTKITEEAIKDNLKKRLLTDQIYTYIGPVLVAVNPFKQLNYFGEKEIMMYQGAAQYEVPPHIFSLADNMYRNMLIDSDSQCVIISGESGAGKTVSAKFIMNYITKVSGGKGRVQDIKDVILESNPLLEAFGNAKTIKNNNSSRFGKYIEIQFSRGGEPVGGKISNFLLEKSRVHFLNENERNFHIFYQLCAGATNDMKEQLGITNPDYFSYLKQSRVYKVDGTNDAHDFQETLRAMSVMGIDSNVQNDILRVVAAILHMGNVQFYEEGNASRIEDPQFLEYPAHLLGIYPDTLGHKLVTRRFDSKWGDRTDTVDMELNFVQAQFARDAWAKGLYSRLFEYIVNTINVAMQTDSREINIGILDIYGFEIFRKNGFEQFCINYVNEKLQQIFIELTLRSEQEEYQSEGIKWKPIDFFNNKVVCDLIESKKPPGVMCVLDDTCATLSAVSEGADEDFRRKLDSQVGNNVHYQAMKEGFTIKHYAGVVSYHVEGFCEKNRDVLFTDIIEVMQSSDNLFLRQLFPENIKAGAKSRPTTTGMKIKTQANELVTTLMKCVPHYIRCIKPNETKKPLDFDDAMVKHQVEYLGLKENIKVKRAGFAYRRPWEKFLQRYAILTRETWPHWRGDPRQGVNIIMASVNMDHGQFQIGKSKVFIKDPESLYMLEECRERKFDHYARIIQDAFKKHFSKQRYMKEKLEASHLVLNRKERRANSINRNFHKGDYIGVEYRTGLLSLIPRREKVEFSLTVNKYDRRFRPQKRDLILTKSRLYLVGREAVKKGPQKGQVVEVVKRKIDLDNIKQLTLSKLPDNFVLLHVKDDYESLLDITFKTEFIMILNRKMKDNCRRELPLNFINSFEYKVKKSGWGGGGTRRVQFHEGQSLDPILTNTGSTLTVTIAHGLAATTKPSNKRAVDPNLRKSLVLSNQNKSNKRSAPRQANPSAQQQNQSRRVVSPPKLIPDNFQNIQPPPPPLTPAPPGQPTIGIIANNINKGPRPPIAPRPQIAQKPKMPTVTALFEYCARDTDELTFKEGDIMELVSEDKSGWWTCKFNGRSGFCPGNYVKKN